jgi:hypothetical protein
MVSWYGDELTGEVAVPVTFTWKRKHDNAVIGTGSYTVPTNPGGWAWYYVYDYFCGFPEDGYYSCTIEDMVHPTTEIEFFVTGTEV